MVPADISANQEQRLLRTLFVLSLLMIATSYLYRWSVTDQRYELSHTTARPSVVVDTAEPSSTQ